METDTRPSQFKADSELTDNRTIKTKDNESLTDNEPYETKVEVISSTCWYLQGEIGHMDIDFLIDSGSTYTIIDNDIFESIPVEIRPQLEETNLRLRSANGELLKVHGKTVLNLHIGNKVFNSPVKVVSLGDREVILGLDFMSDHDCVLYLADGILQIPSHSLKIKLHKQGDNNCARIQASEDIFIPANSEIMMCGHINDNRKTFNSSVGTIELLNSLTQTNGLCVARSLVNTSDSTVPVRIANFTQDTVKLNKGQTVAVIHSVDSDDIHSAC